MERTLKKDRPHNGNYISNYLGEVKDKVSTERITITNDRKKILEVFGNTIKDTKSYLNLPTNTNIQEKLGHIVKDLENTLTHDVKSIDELFHYLKNEIDNANIILNKQQSLIRNHIKNNPIITSNMGPIGIKEFFDDIITTRWSIIGLPDDRGNRIVKDERDYQYYINPRNEILINVHKYFDPYKNIIGANNGGFGGTPFSIYTKDGELIIDRIESYKEVSEYEYYVSVGPRYREKTNKPSSAPSKITLKTHDNKNITFYVDISSQRSSLDGKLYEIDKSKYKEGNEVQEEKLLMN